MSTIHATADARERLAEAVERMADSDTLQRGSARATFPRLLVRQRLPHRFTTAGREPSCGLRAWLDARAPGTQGRTRHQDPRAVPVKADRPARRRQSDSYRVVGFRVVSVFDISQTDGQELPTLDYRPLDGDAPRSFAGCSKRRQEIGLRIEYRASEIAGAHGYLRRSESLIVIDPDQSPAMRAKVLAHELGHYFDPTLAEDARALRRTSRRLRSRRRIGRLRHRERASVWTPVLPRSATSQDGSQETLPGSWARRTHRHSCAALLGRKGGGS